MDASIKLLSISELLGMHFFIPSYQRGYRWTIRQINDLLDDIYGFTKKNNKSENEFYCLQPIVVKEKEWTKQDKELQTINGWEVVDGQQRLTTIRIILTYLIKEHLKGESLENAYGKETFTIDYETREESEYFLNNPDHGSDTNIDFYFISTAYSEIAKWFKKQNNQRDAREAILRTLMFNLKEQKSEGVVQIIWYQMEDNKNPIDTFIRINLGKIPLTNSELIKALFLQERNFGTDFNELAKLKQLEIASEWDRIENLLQDDDFWWFLNNTENKIAARMEYILDIKSLIEIESNGAIIEEIGNDSYSTFRFFYRKFERSNYAFIKSEWKNITDFFYTLLEWYNNPIWYHYIGFLIYSGEKITDLYNICNEETTKENVTKALINLIKNKFAHLKWSVDENDKPYINLSYPKDNGTIRLLLLIFNIQHIVNQSITNSIIFKFPFRSFKKEQWDIEHIDSFTENPLDKWKNQVEWLESALVDLPELIENPDLHRAINEFISDESQYEKFKSLQLEVIEVAGESVKDPATKNGIGNLTLLDAETNRSYGNSLFPTKRRVIIEKDKNGKFIPICTKNVFLKYFDTTIVTNKWSERDIILHRALIAETTKAFLPLCTPSVN